MSLTALALALIAATSAGTAAAELPANVPPVAQKAAVADSHDPAQLINLGIAYAQAGEEAKARAAFEAAVACHEVVDLDTADGQATDSRRLARKALKMLARGEFQTTDARAARLTRRD